MLVDLYVGIAVVLLAICLLGAAFWNDEDEPFMPESKEPSK